MPRFRQNTKSNAICSYLATSHRKRKSNRTNISRHNDFYHKSYAVRVWKRHTTAKLTEFDIIVRHNVAKKNLHERTKKAKLGPKVSIVGELDIYENKLCVELHNFEYQLIHYHLYNPYILIPLCILTIICFRKKNPSVQLTKRIYEYKQPVQEAQDN